MNFPANARTFTTIASGTQNITIESGTSTVYGVHMTQENTASLTNLLCGSHVIARNYAKDYTLDLMQYPCDGALTLSKTGNDEAMVSVTYATGTPQVDKQFTYGDALISFILFTAMVIDLAWIIYTYVKGYKIKQ